MKNEFNHKKLFIFYFIQFYKRESIKLSPKATTWLLMSIGLITWPPPPKQNFPKSIFSIVYDQTLLPLFGHVLKKLSFFPFPKKLFILHLNFPFVINDNFLADLKVCCILMMFSHFLPYRAIVLTSSTVVSVKDTEFTVSSKKY